MEEQNTKSHVYLFFKKIICSFCDMSCNDSSPGIRNMGTVRTMIQLAHVSVFVTHLYKNNLCMVLNLVVTDFSGCPLILLLEISKSLPVLLLYISTTLYASSVCSFLFWYILPSAFCGLKSLTSYSNSFFQVPLFSCGHLCHPSLNLFPSYHILFWITECQDCMQYFKYGLGGHMILYIA